MADPKTAILLTLVHEGGFQNEYADEGNWTEGKVGEGELKGTKYGISAADFPDLDIKDISEDQAVEIYIEKYWSAHYSGIEDQGVANKIFDMGVLFGEGTAVEYLQRILKITVDGAFGPGTLEAVNESDPISLLAAYKTVLVAHALSIGAGKPNDRIFVQGWVTRINS
jgi:lysozyme family protein